MRVFLNVYKGNDDLDIESLLQLINDLVYLIEVPVQDTLRGSEAAAVLSQPKQFGHQLLLLHIILTFEAIDFFLKVPNEIGHLRKMLVVLVT